MIREKAGITRQICEKITATRYEDLGEACVRRVKQAIKDGVAVAIAGSDQRPIQIVAEHVASFGAKPQATVWGRGFKTSPVQAALINGMATHVLDFEPMSSPPTHLVSPTVPVAFALAEAHGLTGKQIVTAVAKGLEAQLRLLYGADQFVPEKLLFHPPGVAGVIGAAVTAGHLLRLDSGHLRHALGIAASRAGALVGNIGSMTKSAHCGNAGASGLDSALLARRGFTANPDILEAHKGLNAAYFPGVFDEARFLAYGNPFRVVDPGLAIKLFPSHFATQFSVTAGLELYPQIAGERIKRMQIRGPVMKYVDRPKPVSGLDGKFSFQYTAAAAVLDGSVKIGTFTDERRFRSDMVALLGKTAYEADDSIPKDLHKMRIEIVVETEEGRRIEAVCRGPKGTWGMPPLADADHLVKLKDCLGRRMRPPQVERTLQLLDGLERQSKDGVKSIIRLLAGGKRA